MLKLAIQHADMRLKAAEEALRELNASTNFDEAETAWTSILLSLNTIYSKLEQGAKGCSKSECWYGKQKHLRKKDPLLRYLHFARNADEHGLKFITERKTGFHGRYIRPTFLERRRVKLQKLNQSTMLPEGDAIDGIADGPTVICVRAFDDRFKDFCDPPETHLGSPIAIPENPDILIGGKYPDVIAELAISFLRKTIDEARHLPLRS